VVSETLACLENKIIQRCEKKCPRRARTWIWKFSLCKNVCFRIFLF